jgi:two-component system chemotaxis response regulator CheB
MTARVVICEDSRTYSHALRRFLEHDDDLCVVGVFETAEELLRQLPRLEADLLTMDLELPGLSGVSAIERIMHSDPQPILVISGHTARGSERAAAALAAGALDAIHKRDLRLDHAGSDAAVALRRRVKRLARTSLSSSAPAPAPALPAAPRAAPPAGREASVVGIVSSTGGPAALAGLLGMLPRDLELPLLVAQHMSVGFTEGLVRLLDETVPPPVRLASDGAFATPGVWFAPDDSNLSLERGMRMRVKRDPRPGHRPSGDVLLASLAAVAGPRSVAVVLTGMGRDGAEGVAAVRKAGGLAMAQDEASSAIHGMPAAAIARGAMYVQDPAGIGRLLTTLRPTREVALDG